jgi:hypothetical protein
VRQSSFTSHGGQGVRRLRVQGKSAEVMLGDEVELFDVEAAKWYDSQIWVK